KRDCSSDVCSSDLYEFPGKPGSPGRWPRQIAPYHLRLDWGMWFLALGSSAQFRWFERLLLSLLEADPATLALLSRDPFHGEAPRWVRARLFDYRYTTPRELRERREWWQDRKSVVEGKRVGGGGRGSRRTT